MKTNRADILIPVTLVLNLGGLLFCGCTSFQPYPAEMSVGQSMPPVVSDASITLPREEMVFRRVSPSSYASKQPDFYLLETEVTNDMYSRFLLATGRIKGDYAIYDAHIAELVRGAKKRLKHDEYGKYGYTSYLDASSNLQMNRMTLWDGQWPHLYSFPVTLITVHDAESFCSWLTAEYPELGTFRLPTDSEWLIAAYGKDRKYPWGDQWQDDAFRYTRRPPRAEGTNNTDKIDWLLEFEETSPEPVKWRPQGRTPEGLYGMWGNVSEMVIHPSNVVNVTFTFVGTRWMGGSFKDSNRESGSGGKEWTSFEPRQDYWGFTHGTNTKEQWLGFRVLLDPNDKEHKYQPHAPYNYEASW